MSERMWLDEQLEKARTERDEAIRQSQGYLKGARELLDERNALRARVAQLEAALTAAQQLIRDLGSPQAADRLGSEFGLKDAPK